MLSVLALARRAPRVRPSLRGFGFKPPKLGRNAFARPSWRSELQTPAPPALPDAASAVRAAHTRAPDVSTKQAPAKRELYLVDGTNLAYRSLFSLGKASEMTNQEGVSTKAPFGFLNSMLKFLRVIGAGEAEPDGVERRVVVVFDAPGGSAGRRRVMADYKATRDKMPEELQEGMPYVKRIAEALGLAVVEQAGVEADDVIGTMALAARAAGTDVFILSMDKDFEQLLRPGIVVLRNGAPGAGAGDELERRTEEAFREARGFEPALFVDYLALVGDKSDNVAGVRGIGEKSAPALLQQFGPVEELLRRLPEVPSPRHRAALEASREALAVAKAVLRIATDVALPAELLDFDALPRRGPDPDALLPLLASLNFGPSLVARCRALCRLPPKGPAPSRDPSAPAGEAAAPKRGRKKAAAAEGASPDGSGGGALGAAALEVRVGTLMRLAREARERGRLAISTLVEGGRLAALCFTSGEGGAVLVPVGEAEGGERRLPPAVAAGVLREVLEDAAVLKVGADLKASARALRSLGIELRGGLLDVGVASYLIWPEEGSRHDLEALAARLALPAPPPAPPPGAGPEALGAWAGARVECALRAAEALEGRLREVGLESYAAAVEMPLVRVLADMEEEGVLLDRPLLEALGAQLEGDLAGLRARIAAAAPGRPDFNPASPKQLAELLYDELGLEATRRTRGGRRATDEAALEALKGQHALPAAVVEWRALAKLRSTYVEGLLALADPRTGRLHTTFNQTVTATGRLSSSSPNLQNIPVRDELGRRVRRAFVARPGWGLLCADYSQIELRIIASMSQDEALLAAFREGEDVHRRTAAAMFGVGPGEVTDEQRRKAKEVNYSIPYGITAHGLAQSLKVDRGTAKALMAAYAASHPGVLRLLEELKAQCRERGYASTLLGRRRHVRLINSRNKLESASAARVAINTPIQGTQADMIKIAMVGVHGALQREGLASRLLLQVHDELVLEVAPGERERVEEIVRGEMTGALPLDGVRVEVSLGFGPSWLDAHS
eukprot:tig00000711_g3412.t1